MQLTFEKTTVIGKSRTKDIECKLESINTARDRKISSKESCYRCSSNHLPSTCQVIDKECFCCKEKSNTMKVCRKRKNLLSRNKTSNVTNAVVCNLPSFL